MLGGQVIAAAAVVVVGLGSLVFYRLKLHPLSRYPGPTCFAASYFPFLYRNCLRGSFSVSEISGLHEQYGSIVRVGPNHLSVDGTVGWEPIYASGRGSKTECEKQKGFFAPFDKDSLINASKSVHRRLRRALMPGFTPTSLRRRGHVVENYTNVLLGQFGQLAESKETFDIGKWLNMATFDIIVHLVLGIRFGCLEKGEYQEWSSMLPHHFRAAALRRCLSEYPPLYAVIETLGLSIDVKKEAELFGGIHMTVAGALQQDSDARIADALISDVTLDGDDAGSHISSEEFATSCITILLAGSETTATTITGLAYFLNHNPEQKKRLQEELSFFADKSGINNESVRNLAYLNGCINETMRLYTPITDPPPRETKSVILGDTPLPDGVRITVFPRSANLSERYFAEPLQFRPERWLPDTHDIYSEMYKNDQLALVRPFSTGPRDCMGKELAWTEMRLFTARIMYEFDVTLADDTEDWLNQESYLGYIRKPLNIQLSKRS